MKYVSHFNTAVHIITLYKGDGPFSFFIKTFFKASKKYGSKDRKNISHLCYCYFRLGHACNHNSIEEKIIAGIFLCDNSPNELLEYFKPVWNASIHLPVKEKILICQLSTGNCQLTAIFPWKNGLAEGIDHEKFCESFLIQPDLFIRLRPGKEEVVKQKLLLAGIAFCELTESCIALSNATKIDEFIEINKEAVIQDYSSQRVGEFLKLSGTNKEPVTAWDCCAASGGKSIMLYDLNPGIKLTVSDIRESILINLKKRFAEAGIKNYTSFTKDLSTVNCQLSATLFDLIIADLPCSGSGTWSRTPEALVYFDEKEIQRYSDLQKKIMSNIIPKLKKNGRLVYITCSVFKKENEEITDFIRQKFHLELEKKELLAGYENKADTMFVASFINP
jgi:16S rRNA (cytosine967-C5)-methyltransferase